jgi:hypothetical protein
LPAVSLAKTRDALIVRDQRATELDCGSNQKSIRRIAIFKMMKLIGAGSRAVSKRHSRDSGPCQETLDPRLNGKVQADPPAPWIAR